MLLGYNMWPCVRKQIWWIKSKTQRNAVSKVLYPQARNKKKTLQREPEQLFGEITEFSTF